MHENLFNESPINLLILWGREHLFGRLDLDDDMKILEAELHKILDINNSDFISDKDISDFEARIANSLVNLKSELTLNLNSREAEDSDYGLVPDEVFEIDPENIYCRVVRDLQILDDIVYLNHAFHCFPNISRYTNIKKRVSKILDHVVADEPPPVLRLIPLNALRRNFIHAISEDIRYLFPWYEKFSELPENSLDLLFLGIAGIINVSDELNYGHLNALWAEMQDDQPLLKEILKKAEFVKFIIRIKK